MSFSSLKRVLAESTWVLHMSGVFISNLHILLINAGKVLNILLIVIRVLKKLAVLSMSHFCELQFFHESGPWSWSGNSLDFSGHVDIYNTSFFC